MTRARRQDGASGDEELLLKLLVALVRVVRRDLDGRERSSVGVGIVQSIVGAGRIERVG